MSNQAKPSPTTPTSQTARSPMTGGTGQGNQSAIPHERIAKRAYEKWCKRGCPQGTHQQDWLEAEAELRAEISGQGMAHTSQPSQPMHQNTGARPGQAMPSVPQKPAPQRR